MGDKKENKVLDKRLIINSSEKLEFRCRNGFGLPIAQQTKTPRHQGLQQCEEIGEQASALPSRGQGAGVFMG